MTDDVSAECAVFAAAVNAVLDGDAPASELIDGHPLTCRDCRELAAAARLLAAAGPGLRVPPAVPADLTPRLVKAMARRRRPWLPALAASLAVAGWVWVMRPSVVPRAESAKSDVASLHQESGFADSARPTAPRVADQWAAVTAVARSASEKAAGPARLLPVATSVRPATPSSDAFASLGQASKAAAAPVTDTARRAVGLFLRDFGLSAKPAG